ncbi:MAG: putative ABC transporter permease [Oscillospiraceae bacterium]|nr:putative ABC transporter permease [Oscillospiraceae bacterium]
MNSFLILTFLFSVGSVTGWGIEVIYRRFVSQKHWVNPGFLTGPWLPLYGFSLCILYLLADIEPRLSAFPDRAKKIVLFLLMAAAITALEFTVGKVMLTVEHVRLWDYTKCFGNIQGIICPQYSFYWMVLSALYYFFVHPSILDALRWLSQNLAFSFAIGFFYGILVIDFAYSAQLMRKMRKYADEHKIVIRLEALREEINYHLQQRKPKFFLSLKTDRPFTELLEEYCKKLQQRAAKRLESEKKRSK